MYPDKEDEVLKLRILVILVLRSLFAVYLKEVASRWLHMWHII